MRTLSTYTGIAMILFAVFIDFVLEPLLDGISFGVLGIIADLIAVCVFGIWLLPYGGLFGKHALGSLTTAAIESIPIFNIVPGWTVRITQLVTRQWRA